MASWRDTFLSLPIDARRRYAELHCKRGMKAKVGKLPPFNPIQTPKHSKQEMLDFAKRHQVLSQDDMYTAIHDFSNENPPSMDQILYLFGSWNNFREEIENDPNCWQWSNRIGDSQLAQYCAMLKLRNVAHYMQLRKTPAGEVLPTPWQIEKRFGSWVCFLNLVLSYNIDKHMDAYFREAVKIGRPLTVQECDKLGIEIRYLYECMTEELFHLTMREKERLFREQNPDSFLNEFDENGVSVYIFEKKRKRRMVRRVKHEGSSPDKRGA